MTVDELQVLITANTNELRKEINKANSSIAGLQKSATKNANGVTSVFKKLKRGIVALGIGKVIKDSISLGMDAIESDSLFETSLGASADAVRAWSDEVSNVLGLNAVAVRKNTGVIYNMTSSMGLSEDNALKMAKGISVLSEDMASFYNLDSAEAFNKLRAGITGETEGLKALGILVDENTIKQVAYSEGIAANGAELTQQQKVLARYVAILKQTGNAQGDLARTIDSPSNQLRILKNQITQAGMALSNFFMPILSAVLPYLTAFAKVATQALTSFSNFLGITGKKDDASKETGKISANVGSIGSGMDDATKKAKKLKGALAGFDEMNVLQDKSSDSDSSSSGATGGGGVDFSLGEYDANLGAVQSKTDGIVAKINNAFASIGEDIDFTNLFKSLNRLKGAVEPLTSKLWDGLKWALDNVLKPIAAWTIENLMPAFFNLLSDALGFVNQVITDLQPIFLWFWDTILSPIAEWTGGVIVSVLNGIGDALKWIAGNEIAMAIIEGVAIAIGLVSVALGVYNTVTTVAAAVSTALGAGIAAINWPLVLITAAIAAVIAVVLLLVKNWDKVKEAASKCWEGIKNIWNKVATWFNDYIIQPVKNFFTGMWDGLKNGAKAAWEGIKSVFSGVANFFKNIFTTAWNGVKSVFSAGGKIFDGIKDGIVTAFKTVVNAIIKGINKVVSLPFEGLNKILDKIHGIKILSVKPFKWLTWRAPVPQLPMLAQGGIVDSPTVAMIGEDGKEAVMPLERNTGWIDQLADKIGEKIGGASGNIKLIVKLGEEAIFDRFIEYGRAKSFETNGEVVFI